MKDKESALLMSSLVLVGVFESQKLGRVTCLNRNYGFFLASQRHPNSGAITQGHPLSSDSF